MADAATIEREQKTRVLPPPLKWAGGKRWLVPQLQPLFAAARAERLVEPFAGGLAAALGLMPQRALLSDANPHLINFYLALKRGFAPRLRMRNERAFYYSRRDRFNELIRSGAAISTEGAELFYYLNRTGFNGLCRFNNRGEFNVPFGRYETIRYSRDFLAYRPMLRRWSFACGDFAELPVERGDFVYVDPPYDVEFTKYAQNDFGWADQERLVEWLQKLRCPIVASNQATARILKLYRKAGFTVRTLPAPRRIACNGDRSPALEMIAVKNLPR